MTDERDIAKELLEDIVEANRVLKLAGERIAKSNGKVPTEPWLLACKEIGATLFIERNRERRWQADEKRRSRGGGGGRKAPTKYAGYPCPYCGHEQVYDNRDSKPKPNMPDFKCANKECGGGSGGYPWAAWIEGKRKDGGRFTRTMEQIFGDAASEDTSEFEDERLAGEPSPLPF